MLRTQFPDIRWLRQKIDERFSEGQGWPTCVLNVKTREHERTDICGPLSIFTNRSGTSEVAVQGHRVRLEPGQYFLSNRREHYDLLYNGDESVETFNIHVEENLMDQVYSGLSCKADSLLDRPDEQANVGPGFFSRLYSQDGEMQAILQLIFHSQENGKLDKLKLDEQLCGMLHHLLDVHHDISLEVARLPSVRTSTRTEIYRRLCVARDFIHSCYERELHLDELARIACMSRYHFLRMFKKAFGQSPYQYLKALRMQKARQWLRTDRWTVGEIAMHLGYENQSSFSRVFRADAGQSPQAFRQAKP